MATICILAKSRQAKDGACIPVLGQWSVVGRHYFPTADYLQLTY